MWERTCSEEIAKLAVWLCGQVTAQAAEHILDKLGGIAFSDTSVWRRVQTWGDKFKTLESLQQVAAMALPQRGVPTPMTVPTSKDMGAAMDGVLIPLRQEGFKELKVGCVFDIELQREPDAETGEGVEVAHAVHNSYTAVLGDPKQLGRALWAEAVRREFPQARDTLALGDGAAWIWTTVVPEHFSTSRQVVDWYHAKEHLYQAAHLTFGEGSAEAMRWAKGMETPLYQGHAWRVAQTIQTLAETHPKVSKALRTEAGYFENNQRRMQYLELREEGFPIGSGMVESGGKQYRARLAGSGMRWSRTGVEHLIPLRTSILNERFDEMWHAVYKSPRN